MKTFYRIIASLIFICCITGCIDHFSEGDEKADKIFALMNAREKAIHDKVDSQWNQKRLLPLRSAVWRGRSSRPSENQMPFSDVAAMIVYINDVELVITRTSMSEDSKKRSLAVKFSAQDPVWYKTICTIAEISAKENGITHETLLKEKSPKATITVDKIKSYEETKELSRYLTKDEIRELKGIVRHCDEAKERFAEIVSYGQPLTQENGIELKRLFLICEAQMATEEMEE